MTRLARRDVFVTDDTMVKILADIDPKDGEAIGEDVPLFFVEYFTPHSGEVARSRKE